MVALEDIKQAQKTIKGIVHRTPLFSSTSLSKVADIDLYFKAENLQKTGSFKARGAANKIASLSSNEYEGVITVSSGNHGQATAYVAGEAGMKALIMVPQGTSTAKIEAATSYGAEVVEGGDLNNVDDIIARALTIAIENNLAIVHPFDDPLIIAGQGTIGLELIEDLPDLDACIVPVGGGGLIAGIATALKSIRLETTVYGVGPDGASSLARSFREKEPIQLSNMPDTCADGIRTPICGHITLPLVQKYVEDVITVTDPEIINAMKYIWERCKLVVEPAAASAFAALLSGRIKFTSDARVVCILSGGNVTLSNVAKWFN